MVEIMATLALAHAIARGQWPAKNQSLMTGNDRSD